MSDNAKDSVAKGRWRARGALLKSKPHGINPKLREQVMERDGYLCQWCRTPGGRLDPHHILPRGRGGTDVLINLVALHRICHDYIHLHPWEAKMAGFLA